MTRKKNDLIGQKFNMLTVISESESHIQKNGRKRTRWLCRCDCGNEKIIPSDNLGRDISCGCKKTKHNGLSHTRIYNIHQLMTHRCYDSKNEKYKNYGARGIAICDEWQGSNGFSNFYNWAINNGYEENLSIDRVNVNGNYEPSNCKWATDEEQANNRTNTIYAEINGITDTISGWSERTGLTKRLIYDRYRSGKTGNDLIKPIGINYLRR